MAIAEAQEGRQQCDGSSGLDSEVTQHFHPIPGDKASSGANQSEDRRKYMPLPMGRMAKSHGKTLEYKERLRTEARISTCRRY